MLEFTTKRLRLEPFVNEDKEELHQIFINSSVREFLWDNEIISAEQTAEILKFNKQQFKDEKCGLWKVKIFGEKKAIGFVGLWYFFEEKQPQLIYGLLPDFTKKGYATEASKAIVTYAFQELAYDHLMAATDKPHSDSQKVLIRLGFQFIEEKLIDNKSTLFYKISRLLL